MLRQLWPMLTAILVAGASLLVTTAQAATFTVNSLADSGNGVCDTTECTLREAVDSLSTASDQVVFDFSGTGQSAPFVIAIDSPLVIAQSGATLDGLACTGCGTVQGTTTTAAAGFDSSLAVRVTASGVHTSGALVSVTGADVTVRGLNLDGGPGVGIRITGDDATIEDCYVGTSIDGTSGTGNVGSGIEVDAARDVVIGPGNVVSGNGAHGVYVHDGNADDPTIQGNIIGLDRSADVADGNASHGVWVHGDSGLLLHPTVGGPSTADGNVISSNGTHGVFVQEAVDGDNVSVISNNLIGVNGAVSAARGNGGDGIRFQGGNSNGTEPREILISDNVVAGNVNSGIVLEACKLDQLEGNAIGTDLTGVAQLGNGAEGVYVVGGGPGAQDTEEITIGGVGVENLIAFNAGDGIRIRRASQAEVREITVGANSIYENGGIGVDIESASSGDGAGAPTPNTCANNPVWGNQEASAPVVSTASLIASILTVTGTACPGATVDIYTADADDEEPETYIGTGTADGTTGLFAIAIPVLPGEGVGRATALQTDADGETGEAAATLVIIAPCDGDGDGIDGTDGGSCAGPDCDDADATTYPGALEACDGVDNDCDGSVPATETDDDSDGTAECDGDCDDTSPIVFPGAAEACDGLDTDCNGVIPPDETDDDGDGFDECADGDCDDTDPSVFFGATEICDGLDTDCDAVVPADETDDDGDGLDECAGGDCDDTNISVFPGAAEGCDGMDTDCDGTVPADELDGDGDSIFGCEGDCDDTDAAVQPGAQEICDGKDSDCDGVIGPEESDSDGDGAIVCDDSDCDDTDASIYAGAPELCDGVDNDCDGVVDEVEDNDADGFTNCDGDCDDLDPMVYPGAEEICDGKDSNCDDAIGADELDDDGDGFIECDGGDCDDADGTINVGAKEVCDDGIDQDCSGEDEPCDAPCDDEDLDGDGMSECDGDCDDGDATVSPDAPEICGDGLDQDCDSGDVPCDDLTLAEAPDIGGCDCEASVAPGEGGGMAALLLGGLLLRRRRRGGLVIPALAAAGALAMTGCVDVGGGTVQTWWGTLPEDGGAATFEAGGGFVAGAVAQAVDTQLVGGRSVVELVIGGDRHPLTCDGLQMLESEFASVEAAVRQSSGAGASSSDLAGWACQELRGVAREVFGGDDWHAIHALVEPDEDGRSRPASEALLPGVFIGKVVDLSGPAALSPTPGEDGCAARVQSRIDNALMESGFLAQSAVSRLNHKHVLAETLSSVDLGAGIDVGLDFQVGLAGPAQEGEVDITSFVSAADGMDWDTVVFSTEGDAIATEPCASFGLTRSLAWPELEADASDDGGGE